MGFINGARTLPLSSFGVALGTGSVADTQATAVGFSSSATGLNSTAIGNNALAVGVASTAVGSNSTAAFGGAAFGAGATATGVPPVDAQSSAAFGRNASATNGNDTAIGNNVSTTRANQISVGNTTNQYTFAGITSPASASFQTGPLQVVTSDADGNLATDGGQIFRSLEQPRQQDQRPWRRYSDRIIARHTRQNRQPDLGHGRQLGQLRGLQRAVSLRHRHHRPRLLGGSTVSLAPAPSAEASSAIKSRAGSACRLLAAAVTSR